MHPAAAMMPTSLRCSVHLLLLSLLAIISLAACAEKQKFTTTTTVEQFKELHAKQQDEDALLNKIDPMPMLTDELEDEYLLGSGDLLVIKVLEESNLNSEPRVSSTGTINVPLLGEVSVLNLTTSETEQKIAELYQQDYIHNPHVSVYIKERLSKQITLVGAVEKPGTYEYVAQRRLLDVLAIGNGLKKEAGSFAYVTRKDSKTRQTQTYLVDLEDLVKNGNMAHNHIVRGGDVIFVPESGQCFVDGAVRKPGTYPLKSNMTVTEAIVLAGGLAGYADDDSIKLVRFMGRGKERQVVNLKYSDLQAGIGDTLVLKDQDIIYAESSASGKFFSGAGFTLGFMGTGVSFKDPAQ
jgi:polysaccharide biosynthesis/export protein